MEFIQRYCGKALFKVGETYMVGNVYTEQIECMGSLEKCQGYFDDYVKKLSERDI